MHRCSESVFECSPICNHCKAYRDDNPYYRSGRVEEACRGELTLCSAGKGTCLKSGERTDPCGDCDDFECFNVPYGEVGFK